MSVTATTTPTYPVGGRDIIVAFTITGTGNYLKGYFTDAPIGSAVKTKLTSTGATRMPAFEVDAAKTWTLSGDQADKGGVYVLTVEQYTKGIAYGGGYQDSPASFATETLISSSTVAILVGQKVTQKIGIGGDTATLTLFVVGNTVRASTDLLHGFTSPIIDDTKSPKALTASLNTGVLTAVAALADQLTSTVLGDPAGVLSDILVKYSIHALSLTYHAAADTDNIVSTAFANPSSPEGLNKSCAELRRRLDQHMRNDTGGGTPSAPLTPGTGSGAYHVVSTVNLADWQNALLNTSPGAVLDTFVAIADLWRAYHDHLASTAVHLTADVSHRPTALPPLLAVHELFLAELQKQSPTAPASVNSGVTALVHGAGFEEA